MRLVKLIRTHYLLKYDMMIKFDFHKYKYGRELLVDCFNLSEIAGRSMAMKEFHAASFYEMFFFRQGAGSVFVEGKKLIFGPLL